MLREPQDLQQPVMLQVFLAAFGLGVYLIIFVFFPPLDAKGQGVDMACSGWMTECKSR